MVLEKFICDSGGKKGKKSMKSEKVTESEKSENEAETSRLAETLATLRVWFQNVIIFLNT